MKKSSSWVRQTELERIFNSHRYQVKNMLSIVSSIYIVWSACWWTQHASEKSLNFFRSQNAKEWYRKTTSYLEQPSRHFCQHFMRRTQQTLLAKTWRVNRKQQSSPLSKQLKLLAVPFKPLRCCLRRDKLVNCHVWTFCKDLFLNFRVIWSVNQIVLFNGFLSDFVEITLCVYTKTIILFNLGE